MCSKRGAATYVPSPRRTSSVPQRDEPAERLPDRRAADAVALHQLELGLDLGAGRQLAGADPVAQVRLDPAVERAALTVATVIP